MKFFKDYSAVLAKRADGSAEVAISKEDSYRREYRYLEATSSALREVNRGIGSKAPSEFFKMLSESKIGDVLVFDKGHSYVCDGKMGPYVSFKETCSKAKSPKFSDMRLSEGFTVDVSNESSVQDVFRKTKDAYTDDVKLSVTSISDSRLILNSLLANIEETKEINLGANKVVAQKNKEGKGLVYFDQTGSKISEEQVLLMLSWFEARPNEIEINRIRPATPLKEFDDVIFERSIDEALAKRDYSTAINLAKGYCALNGGTLELDMSSYVKKDGEYEAVSYLFRMGDDGQAVIKKVSYEGNDFNRNVLSITEVDELEIIDYCEQKYDEKFKLVKSMLLDKCFV